jgi:hypothetical protein
MIKFLRWILFLPLGILSAYLTHVFVRLAIGLMHGFDNMALFWAATDMAGMPLTGTYAIILNYTAVYCALIYYTVRAAPSDKIKVAKLISTLCGLFVLILMAYISWLLFKYDVSVGFWVLYRSTIETLSAVMGIIAGYAISKEHACQTDTSNEVQGDHLNNR